MFHARVYIIMCLAALAFAACNQEDSVLDGFPVESVSVPAPEGFPATRAEDEETHRAFLRNFGVGYGYNAVRGEYCRWEDIRCQVVNRRELEHQNFLGNILFVSQTMDVLHHDQQFCYSLRDYVSTIDFSTRVSIDFGLYSGEARTHTSALEDGLQEKFFFTCQDRIELGEQYISTNELMYDVQYSFNDNLLTTSFQEAVEYLAWADESDLAVVDSFINIWGTHVIVRSVLGATLRLDLKNDMWRYQDVAQDEKYTVEKVMWAFKNRKESRQQREGYHWIEHSSLNIMARGGDQSLLTSLIGEAHYDGTRDFNVEEVSDWRASVRFDPDDEEHSNVEMVYMEVRPIWDFIKYSHVRRRVKAAVMQDVALQQELLGNVNFFDATFPIRYPKASCQWSSSAGSATGGGNTVWTTYTRSDSSAEPMVVNIESGGRYLATVCHETIDGLDLWVCYPIYEGKVKLPCGLGVADDNSVYNVQWLNGTPTLTRRLGETATDSFYITAGAVGVSRVEEIHYAEGRAMPYIELAGGIQPDGTYRATPCTVMKQGPDFVLTTTAANARDLIGFTLVSDNRYVRNSNYTYIYNPKEIR